MKHLLAILALSLCCFGTETNEQVIVVTLNPQDVWAVKQQLLRLPITRTNVSPTTVSNYVVNMFHNQIKGFTAMELQQAEWEKRAKLLTASPEIQAQIHALLGITNPPPILTTPPTP